VSYVRYHETNTDIETGMYMLYSYVTGVSKYEVLGFGSTQDCTYLIYLRVFTSE